MNIIELLKNDYRLVSKFKPKKFAFFRVVLSPSFICTSIFRLSMVLNYYKIPLIPRLIWWINFLVFKVDIDQRCRLLGGIYFPHPFSIVIGEHVRANASIKVMQGSTLGGNLGRTLELESGLIHQPVFLFPAFIGVNSVILGPLVFSGKVFVASNSTVTKARGEGVYYGLNNYSELKEDHLKELFDV